MELSTSLYYSSAEYSPTNYNQVIALLKNIQWFSTAYNLKYQLFNLTFKALTTIKTFSVHIHFSPIRRCPEILYTFLFLLLFLILSPCSNLLTNSVHSSKNNSKTTFCMNAHMTCAACNLLFLRNHTTHLCVDCTIS